MKKYTYVILVKTACGNIVREEAVSFTSSIRVKVGFHEGNQTFKAIFDIEQMLNALYTNVVSWEVKRLEEEVPASAEIGSESILGMDSIDQYADGAIGG